MTKSIQQTLGDFFIGMRAPITPSTPTEEYQPPALPRIDPQRTMRLCFQNVHGAHPRTALEKWMEAMSRIADLQIGVIGLSDINANMHIDSNQVGLQYRWKNMKMIGGSCTGESIESHLQGGTLLAVSEGYENRVRDSKMDPQQMGYFSYMKLEGKGGAKILIISYYRPCRGSTKGGEGTIWKQQWSRAQHLGLGEDYDPRR
jgi:hypothetical protein